MATSARFLPGNRLTLLNSGAEFFPALLTAINEARQEVHLESYIFEDDRTGHDVAGALMAAARRGVSVRVLVDGFGAAAFATTLMPALADAGVMALVYRPEYARFKLRRHRLRRLHRKLAAIDDEIAFVGGINIIDDLNNPDQSPGRYDYAVRVEGPVLLPIRQTMRRLWEVLVWVNFKRRYRLAPVEKSSTSPRGDQQAAFLIRDNVRHRRDIEKAYLAAIAGARDSILIANAYFLPGRRFRRALGKAAQRGVQVSILLQGRIEYRLLHYATQALYDKLLKAGIRIFEYQNSFLHAKVAVIDEQWATVGSSNIDPFSLLLSREANLVVLDRKFAEELRRSLGQAMQSGASELSPQQWQHLPWYSRLLRWGSYNLLRIAIGFTGYGGKH
ncbi:MAG: cardiolipin synthase ClsB [Propionivibrio sp.]|nr:cardiolipin synthase ClsB [Propionivibrio sp.]